MKRLLIPLLIAALVCLGFTAAAAEGDKIAFDASINAVSEGETLQTVLNREGDAAGGELTYTSSDSKIATVDEAGVVTGIKKGKAVITAVVKTEKKTYKAQLKLTVIRPVSNVTVNTAKLPVYQAADEKVASLLQARENAEENELPVLLVSVKKKVQLAVGVEPKDATDRAVTLTGDNPEAFTVTKNVITGVAPGEGILTIASQSNPDISVRYRVLVVQPVTKLTVQASAPFVTVGGEATVSATFTPENASIPQVIWSSGDERIATVDAGGKVTGVKRGNGRIIATAADGSNIRANFNLKVVQNPESISLASEEVTIDVGRNAVVKATVLPKDTDNKKLIWTSSDESIATVGKDGRIKAIARGDCTVTCTCEALDSVTATLKVHVQQPVKKVSFDGKQALVYVGETTQLNWNIEPADASNPTLTFTSKNEKVATVDANGVVTGVKGGKTTITAVTTDGSKRKASITVQAGEHVRSVSMIRRHAYIDVGETATAGANIEPKDALNKNMSWSTSDPNIVTASGNTNHKMKLRGINRGEAVVTGVTEDGGFEATLPVTVGDFEHGITFESFDFDNAGNFYLVVKNNLKNLTITQITAEVVMFNATDGENTPLPINTKNGSNKVSIVWNGTLKPGEKTGKNHWKMYHYKLPDGIGIYDTRGTVTVDEYQIENDWIKTIRHKVLKDY